MENKYYTPSIEEFHVGFECEVYINTQRYGSIKKNEDTETDNADSAFYPMIFGNKNSKYELLVLGELIHTQKLNVDKFRVKYLDNEDIESLGFKDPSYSVCNWYKLEGHFEDSFASYGYWTKIRLIHCALDNKIKILAYEYTWEEVGTPLFAGEIKNKSEFKVLLEQLNLLPSSI